MPLFLRLVFIVSILASTAFAIENALAESRVALIVGNGAYQNAPQLPNPANDANDVAAALKRDGFETIIATDLNRDRMEEVTIRFARAVRTADVAIFYYSGHAIQFGGINYLAPVDIQLKDEADLRRMIRLDEIVSDLEQAKNLRILVLDACRDNPLADQLKRSIGITRSLPLERGLAKIASPQGMIVAYATQAGKTADDGTGRNSPYTAAFLKNIEAKGEIGTIFRRISADVYEATNHRQLPELSLSFIGEFYLRGRVELSNRPDTAVVPPDTTKEDFDAAERIDTIGAWNAFLVQHPTGYYAALAKERRANVATRVVTPTPATRVLTMQECAEKYKVAKEAGTLNGRKWNDYRKVECGADAAAMTPAASTAPAPTATAKESPPAAVPAVAPASAEGIVFPRAIDPKYGAEEEGRARMHTCVDQYNANKGTNANGDLKWIEKGGGYYSECNRRLKGT
jgi:hypothetical protein